MPLKKTAEIKDNDKLEHFLPDLMTVVEFAKFKTVAAPSVYDAINRSKITPVVVGHGRAIYIDSKAYADYEFRQYPRGQYPRKKND